MTTPNSDLFSPSTAHLQLFWDSTSLGEFKTCPRKYYYRIIEGWIPRHEAIPIAFGLLFHSALERYDRERANGHSHLDSMRSAVRYALRASGERSPDGVWSPWEGDKIRNRFSLIRAIVWYLETYGADDPIETVILHDGSPAVELSFRFSSGIQSASGEEFVLIGHLDKLGRFANEVFFIDRKSTGTSLTSSYFDRFSPDNQMSLYALAARVVFDSPVSGGIIDAVQLAVNFARPIRGFIHRTPAQVEEWLSEVSFWFRLAEACAQSDSWPMNDRSCFNYGGCPYRQICSRDPSVRDIFLNSEFIRSYWNPLEIRGPK